MKKIRLTESDLRRIITKILKEDEIDLKAEIEPFEKHSSIPGCNPTRLDFQRCTTEAFKTLPAAEFTDLFAALSKKSEEPLDNPLEKMGDMMESRIRRKYRY